MRRHFEPNNSIFLRKCKKGLIESFRKPEFGAKTSIFSRKAVDWSLTFLLKISTSTYMALCIFSLFFALYWGLLYHLETFSLRQTPILLQWAVGGHWYFSLTLKAASVSALCQQHRRVPSSLLAQSHPHQMFSVQIGTGVNNMARMLS